MRAYGVSLSQISQAIKKGNRESGARVVEFSGAEYMIRAKGYVKDKKDIEHIVVSTGSNGIPIYVKNLARVSFGPEIRRGIGDLDGMGDVVGGIVVMRSEENAYKTIELVKKKIEELKPTLPKGVEIVETYNRGETY